MKTNKLFLSVLFVFVIYCIVSCTKGSSNDTPVTPSNSPTLTAIVPAKALPNSAISITGTNFTTDLTKITVTFNGVAATVNSATSTEIVATVPASAKTGNVVLVCNGTTLTSSTFTVTAGTQTTYAYGNVELISIDGSGNMYAVATGSDVYKIIPGGSTTSTFAGNGYNGIFFVLAGIAIDAAGNVYVADAYRYVINKITPGGTVSVFAGSGTAAYKDGTGTSAQFLSPIGLAIDASGNLYTCDAFRVRKITPAGVVTTLAGSGVSGNVDGQGTTAQFAAIGGIAVDASGNVYVSDTKNLNIRKISATGLVTTIAGSGTAGFADGQGTAAQFTYPQGMAVDAAGNVFVSDNLTTNLSGGSNGPVVFSIRMINKAGLVTTFIKDTYTAATAPGTTINGPIGIATTIWPNGIAFDTSGNMYIANNYIPPFPISKITFL